MKIPLSLCLIMLATAYGNPVETNKGEAPEPPSPATTLNNVTVEGWVRVEEGMLQDSAPYDESRLEKCACGNAVHPYRQFYRC